MIPTLLSAIATKIIINKIEELFLKVEKPNSFEMVQNKDMNDFVRFSINHSLKYLNSVPLNNADSVKAYLTSDNVLAILKLLAAQKTTQTKSTSPRELFIQNAKKTVTPINDEMILQFESLFSLIENQFEYELNNEIAKGSLLAFDIKTDANYAKLTTLLSNIEFNLTTLINNSTSNNFDQECIFQDYQHQALMYYSKLELPSLTGRMKIDIDAIYVDPPLSPLNINSIITKTSTYEATTLVSSRSVLLGSPGSGKSTFAHKLAFELLTKRIDSNSTDTFTPVVVRLRDYENTKSGGNDTSLINFILNCIDRQFTCRLERQFLESKLITGKVFLIFDGLDELLDTSYRRDVSDQINALLQRYPFFPTLITSREVGYHDAPIEDDLVSTYKILSFTNDQVALYASKWFRLNCETYEGEAHELTESFMLESATINDLRVNPLLLSLLCQIYRGNRYIPKNRPEVYEKCASLLFETWDAQRGLKRSQKYEHIRRPLLAYLAHWMYSNHLLRSEIRESQLINTASKYLIEKHMLLEDEAIHEAKLFIDSFIGRTWVLSDVGLSKNNERLFAFTHLSFLEYYTALHVNRTHETTINLYRFFVSKLTRNEWHNVAELCFQIRSANFENGANELVSCFNDSLSDTYLNDETLSFFALKTLAFLTPSPNIVQAFATRLAKIVADSDRQFTYNDTDNEFLRWPDDYIEFSFYRQMIHSFLTIHLFNAKIFYSTFLTELVTNWENNRVFGALSNELTFSLGEILSYIELSTSDIAESEALLDYISDCNALMNKYWKFNANLIFSAMLELPISIADAVDIFGIGALTSGSKEATIFLGYSSVIEVGFMTFFDKDSELTIDYMEIETITKKIGEFCLSDKFTPFSLPDIRKILAMRFAFNMPDSSTIECFNMSDRYVLAGISSMICMINRADIASSTMSDTLLNSEEWSKFNVLNSNNIVSPLLSLDENGRLLRFWTKEDNIIDLVEGFDYP